MSNEMHFRLRDCLVEMLTDASISVQAPQILNTLPIDIDFIVDTLLSDAQTYAARDPASSGDPMVIVSAYTSFSAVVHYRLAHALWLKGEATSDSFRVLARRLSERGKLHSGADIHPGAVIGKRFVLDHAFGTVIGETTEIGDDVYILGGVTLGAQGISANPSGKRHPTLGDRVQVGAFARILGPVILGDDVFVCPHAVVTKDIPSGMRVSIVNQLQVMSCHDTNRAKVYGVIPAGDDMLTIIGDKFVQPTVNIVNDCFEAVRGVKAHVKCYNSKIIEIAICISADFNQSDVDSLHLQLVDEGNEISVINPPALAHVIKCPSFSFSPLAGHPSTENIDHGPFLPTIS